MSSDQPLTEKLSALLLIGAIIAGFVYPTAAWPEFATLIGGSIVAAALLAALGIFTDLYRAQKDNEKRDLNSLYLLGTLVMIGLIALGSGPVAAFERSWNGMIFISLMAFLAAYRLGFMESVPRLRLVWLIAISLTISSAYGVYQSLGPSWAPKTFAALTEQRMDLGASGGIDGMEDRLAAALRQGRAWGTLGAPNLYACLCIIGFVASSAIYFLGRHRSLSIGMALLNVLALFLSGSRGGFLAFLVALALVVTLCIAWRYGKRAAVYTSIVGISIVGIVAAIIIALSLSGTAQGLARLSPTGITFRVQYWQTAVEIIKNENGYRLGAPGSFEAFYPKYRMPGSDETIFPHNWILEYALSGGIFFTVFVMILLVIVFWKAEGVLGLARWQNRKEDFVYTCFLTIAVLSILAHGLVEYTLSFRELSVFAYALLGLLCGSIQGVRAKVVADDERMIKDYHLILVGAFVVLLLFSRFPNLMLAYEAEVSGRSADNKRAIGEALASIESDPIEALKFIDAAIATDPKNFRNWQSRAWIRYTLGRGNWRLDSEKARELNPYSAELIEFVSVIEAREGRLDEAITLQQQAIENHPLALRHRLRLIEFFLQAERIDEARAELEGAQRLRARSQGELTRLANFAEQLSGAKN